jgi:hypothetical protein
MPTTPSRNTDRAAADISPIAVTVQRACELSGLGPTSIWGFLKDGRLEAVRVPGVRRTLVGYSSLVRLLTPPESSPNAQFVGRALDATQRGKRR